MPKKRPKKPRRTKKPKTPHCMECGYILLDNIWKEHRGCYDNNGLASLYPMDEDTALVKQVFLLLDNTYIEGSTSNVYCEECATKMIARIKKLTRRVQ